MESIASKNPKELTGLLEQISGSDDLKRDYEKYEVEKGIAEEKAAIVYQKKRTIVAERKQKKEQKEEAEKHIRLQNELVCISKLFFSGLIHVHILAVAYIYIYIHACMGYICLYACNHMHMLYTKFIRSCCYVYPAKLF